jgi:hypothetical protein
MTICALIEEITIFHEKEKLPVSPYIQGIGWQLLSEHDKEAMALLLYVYFCQQQLYPNHKNSPQFHSTLVMFQVLNYNYGLKFQSFQYYDKTLNETLRNTYPEYYGKILHSYEVNLENLRKQKEAQSSENDD